MIAKNIELTFLKVTHLKGIGKTSGREYDFHQVSFLDEKMNTLSFSISDDLITDSIKSLGVVPVEVDVYFSPMKNITNQLRGSIESFRVL